MCVPHTVYKDTEQPFMLKPFPVWESTAFNCFGGRSKKTFEKTKK